MLLVKVDHIGDLVLATPAIRAVRSRFPTARITALVSSWTRDILAHDPDVDEVLTFDFFPVESGGRLAELSREETRELSALLGSRKFDVAIDLRVGYETREFLSASGAGIRVAFGPPHWVERPERPASTIELDYPYSYDRHQVEKMLDLVRVVGADTDDRQPRVHLSDREKSFAEEYLAGKDVRPGRRLIGVHPGCREDMRRWPPERFAELLDEIDGRIDGAQVVLFGGPQDSQAVAEILERSRSAPIVCNEPMSLLEFAAVAARMDVVVGNNSGPVHVASGVGTPVVTAFSGQVSPAEWSAVGDRNLAVSVELSCSPCYGPSCGTVHSYRGRELPLLCLHAIRPESVREAIERVIGVGR